MEDRVSKKRKVKASEPRAGFFRALCSALDPAAASNPTNSGLPGRLAIVFLSALLFALFIPFIQTAFRIDDPLFIWAARHIQVNPTNPYGFTVNWYGAGMAMSEVTKNPPLASYFIALAGLILGWSEPALRLMFIGASLAVAIGTYLVAVRLCARPLLATLAAVLTPVFFISSLTVMSDVLMLAFWVFAVYFWMKGLDTKSHAALGAAGLLIAASAITKYFGMALIPLLLVYSIFKKRAPGWWLIHMVIPVAILAVYQGVTAHLYGRGLLFDAAAYATEVRGNLTKFQAAKIYVNFAFSGGCIATALFFARQLWSRRVIIGGLVFSLSATLLFLQASAIGSFSLPSDKTAHLLLAIQLSVWGVTGISLIALAADDLYRNHDSDSVLLFLWIIGTFLFAAFINWTTNGRSILPMTLPAGILIARRLEWRAKPTREARLAPAIWPLAGAAILSLAVAGADSALANAARTGAARVQTSSGRGQVWFQGHWGFQYYMEQSGAKPMDGTRFTAKVGDVVVVPTTNTNTFGLPAQWPRREVFEVSSTRWISTMNHELGAGFYTDVYGPLPFAIGTVRPERFEVFEIRK